MNETYTALRNQYQLETAELVIAYNNYQLAKQLGALDPLDGIPLHIKQGEQRILRLLIEMADLKTLPLHSNTPPPLENATSRSTQAPARAQAAVIEILSS